MLQIPQSHFNTQKQYIHSLSAQTIVPAEKILDFRQQLFKELDIFSSSEDNFKKINQLIRQISLEELKNETALKEDLVVLNHYFKENQKKDILVQGINRLKKERQIILSAAKKSVSIQILTDYLKKQLTVYKNHLKILIDSKEDVEREVNSLYKSALEQTFLAALHEENLSLACEILTQYGGEFSKECLAIYTTQITWLFARQRAEELWNQVLQKFPHFNQEATNWIEACNKESNPLIRQYITTILKGKQHSFQKMRYLEHIDLLGKILESSVPQAFELLLNQDFLEPNELELYQELCALLDQPATKPDPNLFVKLYFSGEEKDAYHAYQQGKLSAKDYFFVRREQLLRACGIKNLQASAYCKKIDQQLHEKNFSKAQIDSFQYELLTSLDLEVAWEKFENLFKK